MATELNPLVPPAPRPQTPSFKFESNELVKFALTLRPTRRAPAGVGGLNGLAPTAADPEGKPFERSCDARDGRTWASQNSQTSPRDTLLAQPKASGPSASRLARAGRPSPGVPRRSRTSGLQRIALPSGPNRARIGPDLQCHLDHLGCPASFPQTSSFRFEFNELC